MTEDNNTSARKNIVAIGLAVLLVFSVLIAGFAGTVAASSDEGTIEIINNDGEMPRTFEVRNSNTGELVTNTSELSYGGGATTISVPAGEYIVEASNGDVSAPTQVDAHSLATFNLMDANGFEVTTMDTVVFDLIVEGEDGEPVTGATIDITDNDTGEVLEHSNLDGQFVEGIPTGHLYYVIEHPDFERYESEVLTASYDQEVIAETTLTAAATETPTEEDNTTDSETATGSIVVTNDHADFAGSYTLLTLDGTVVETKEVNAGETITFEDVEAGDYDLEIADSNQVIATGGVPVQEDSTTEVGLDTWASEPFQSTEVTVNTVSDDDGGAGWSPGVENDDIHTIIISVIGGLVLIVILGAFAMVADE